VQERGDPNHGEEENELEPAPNQDPRGEDNLFRVEQASLPVILQGGNWGTAFRHDKQGCLSYGKTTFQVVSVESAPVMTSQKLILRASNHSFHAEPPGFQGLPQNPEAIATTEA
jgi:hypothetical protein